MTAIEFWKEALFFSWELFKFMILFYSVWAPAFLLAALLSSRYRSASWNGLLANRTSGTKRLLSALVLGTVGSSGRKTSLNTMRALLARGVSPSLGITFLIASRNMTVYFWAILALSLGAEFATGAIIGALVMIGLIVPLLNRIDLKVLPSSLETGYAIRFLHPAGSASWSSLLFSLQGWFSMARFLRREVQGFAPSLIVGIGLAGVIFAAGLERWWHNFADVFGHATLPSDLLNAFAGAGLSVLLSLSPIGNLPVVHALFKTDALGYPGVASFCLASVINIRDIRAYFKVFGKRQRCVLAGSLYVTAILGSLGSTWLYAAVGFRPELPPLKLASKLFNAVVEFIAFQK